MKKKIFDLKFLKEAGLLGSSNLINAASNGLIVVQLNKYILAEQAGVFLYLLAIASPLFIFFGFDLRRKITVNQLDGLSLTEIFSLRNTFSIIGIIIFALISVIVVGYDIVFFVALLAIGIGKIFDTVTETNYAIYQHHNCEIKIFASRLLKLAFSCVAFVIGSKNNYLTIFSLYALLNILPFFIIDLGIIRKIEPTISLLKLYTNFGKIKTFVAANLSLAISSFIMVITPNIPTYFVKNYLDYSNVTYFTSVNFILQALYVGGGAGLGYAMLKKFRTEKREDYKEHTSLLVKSSVISLATYTVFGVVFYLVNGLVLLFGDKYKGIYSLFFLLLYSGYFFTVASFLNNYLLFLDLRRLVFRLRIVRIVTIVFLCVIFPSYSLSLDSFGYALLLTNVVDCLLHVIIIFIKAPCENNFRGLVKYD